MKVLVTGVGGTLGAGLARALAAQGHDVRGASFSQANIPGVECISADMADHDTCIRLGEGVDVIAHMGAYHGPHLKRTNPEGKTEREFFDANVASTFYLFRSAVENGAGKVVLASSVVAYERDHWTMFGIYGFTKVLGEEIGQFFSREHGLRFIALRYGAFTFDDLAMRGFGMLGGWNCLELDEAVRAAVAAVENEAISYGIYDVQTPLPFTPEERWAYQMGDKVGVLAKRWPQHAALIERHAHLLPASMNTVDMRRTLADLNIRFEHDFAWFLDELARRETGG